MNIVVRARSIDASKGGTMNATDLMDLRSSLLLKKGSILNKSDEFKLETFAQREVVSDEAEAASNDVDLSLSLHLHERDRMALYQIEKALSKIADGTYGQCEGCGQIISKKRLQVSPFASLCIECKEEQEDPRTQNN